MTNETPRGGIREARNEESTRVIDQGHSNANPNSTESPTPYNSGAPFYLDVGWTGVLPLPPRSKASPPTGFTGWNANDPPSRMIELWRSKTTGDYQAASNICIHMPDGQLGIDVDHYGNKRGADTLALLEKDLGPLPPTYTSTSRPGTPSGIKWFRVPPGLHWPTGPGKDIEFIHTGHRYAMVWPSLHDKTGDMYVWLDHAGQLSDPPEADACAELPWEWVARFTGGEQRGEQPDYRAPTEDERTHCLTDGPPCYAVTKVLNSWRERTTVKARHDAMLQVTFSLVRHGEQGHKGVLAALTEFHDTFVKCVHADRIDGAEESEYARAVNGAIAKVSQTLTADENRGCCGQGNKKAQGNDYGWNPDEETDDEKGRWVDLDQFLDGSYTPPQPTVGASRKDGIQFLYPGRWHTLIGLTTAGKTMWALWQVKAVMEDGGHVIYIHFEEANPAGTIARLRDMGVDAESIRKRLHWGHTDSPWQWNEMAAELTRLEDVPVLAVLDGINAACGMHDWAVKEPESVGKYRAIFVHPLLTNGCTVLSVGHPPKAANRQTESYSYGAAGWLNDVDGASFRMKAGETPIHKGGEGSSAVYVVKDRYSEVQTHGTLQADGDMPWWYMGQFIVDSSDNGEDNWGTPDKIRMKMVMPNPDMQGSPKDKYDKLAGHILEYLRQHAKGRRFESGNDLETKMRAKGYTVTKADMPVALQRLLDREEIEWPEVPKGQSRPGWLPSKVFTPEGS